MKVMEKRECEKIKFIKRRNSDDRINKLTKPLRIVERGVHCHLFISNESLEHSLRLSPQCP
jgi:hypothetical protein